MEIHARCRIFDEVVCDFYHQLQILWLRGVNNWTVSLGSFEMFFMAAFDCQPLEQREQLI